MMVILAALTAQPGSTAREMPVVEVHEWGVLTLGEGSDLLLTHPGENLPVAPPDTQMVDRAPVVYFYGPPFTGRFEAVAASGEIVGTWPATSGEGAEWSFRAGYAELDALCDMPYAGMVDGWNAEPWRAPESMILLTDRGQAEKFLYYECTADREVLPVLPAPRIGAEVREGFEGIPAAIVIPSHAGPVVMPLRAGILSDPLSLLSNSVVEPVDLLPLLYEWSAGILDIEEVDALWATWREWMMSSGLPSPESGRVLLVYPVPAECLEGVSTLSLETAEQFTIEYDRFILAAMEIGLR